MVEDTELATCLMDTFVVRVRVDQPDGEPGPAGFVQHVRSGSETRFAGMDELVSALNAPRAAQETP